ncbi:MAG: linear amide C-N hydrolase [Winogradskyella sp.]
MNSPHLLKSLVEETKGFGCTAFTIQSKDKVVFGRNFDFMIDYGHILVNKRNVSKTTLVSASEKQFQWTSKFGSISFNQLGREFPYGGMNESGFVIEQLWLDSTEYPHPDDRFGISVLQWIQYHLDTATTINDVVDSDTFLRIIDDSGVNLHFFLSDKSGESACIEFLNNKMVVVSKEELVVKALTNTSYQESIKGFCSSHIGKETYENPYTSNSFFRFEKTAKLLREFNSSYIDIVDYSFSILSSVKQADYTQWSIVYDISNLEIHFKSKTNQSIQTIQLNSLDFSSQTESLFSEIRYLKFKEYSSKENFKLINQVFDSLDILKSIPKEIREVSSKYPESTIFNDNQV